MDLKIIHRLYIDVEYVFHCYLTSSRLLTTLNLVDKTGADCDSLHFSDCELT